MARGVPALLALCCCGAFAATAGAAAAEDVLLAAADLPRPQFEVNASTIPQIDARAQSSRIDLSLMPRQQSGVGLSMGLYGRPEPGLGFTPPQPIAPRVDVGVHWRYTSKSNQRFDVVAYRRAPEPDAITLIEGREPSYGARLEMGLAASKGLRNGFVAERGFVGLQLESGAKVTIRRKFGGPMLYYRNTFY